MYPPHLSDGQQGVAEGVAAHPNADSVESSEIIIIGEDGEAASSSEEDGSAIGDGGSAGTSSTHAGA